MNEARKRRCSGLLASRRYQKRGFLEYFAHDSGRKRAEASCFSRAPVETLKLVRKDRAADLQACWYDDFERIPFDLPR